MWTVAEYPGHTLSGTDNSKDNESEEMRKTMLQLVP